MDARVVARRLPPEPVLWTDDYASEAFAGMRASLAANIRARRDAAGLSQARAAERAALSWVYWRQLENATGEENPTLRVLMQVAAALGVEVAALLSSHGSTVAIPTKRGVTLVSAGRKRTKRGSRVRRKA